MIMNPYGERAQRHWAQFRPKEYGQIPESDRESFFTTLGDEIETEIVELAQELAGPDPKGETFKQKWGRLNMARLNAESQVLSERLVPEEAEETPLPH